MQFYFGIFVYFIFVNGDYLDVVKNIVGNCSEVVGIFSCLLSFIEEEKEMVKGSYDLFGVNYYFIDRVVDIEFVGDEQLFDVDEVFIKSGDLVWLDWFNGYVVFFGFCKLLKYIKDNYNDLIVIVIENGVVLLGEVNKIGEDWLNDVFRVDYYKR